MTPSEWRLVVSPTARRDLARLSEKAMFAVLETVGALGENPRRMGKALHFEFEGAFSARRGPYRVIYRIDAEAGEVRIVAVGHRGDVYRPR